MVSEALELITTLSILFPTSEPVGGGQTGLCCLLLNFLRTELSKVLPDHPFLRGDFSFRRVSLVNSLPLPVAPDWVGPGLQASLAAQG